MTVAVSSSIPLWFNLYGDFGRSPVTMRRVRLDHILASRRTDVPRIRWCFLGDLGRISRQQRRSHQLSLLSEQVRLGLYREPGILQRDQMEGLGYIRGIQRYDRGYSVLDGLDLQDPSSLP